MVKMIFSDFDQTLLDYHSKKNFFDDYQVSIFKKLNDKGIMFCIVTGRDFDFFRKFDNVFPFISYIISSNGACIYDVKMDKIIYKREIDESAVNFLLDYVVKNDYDLFYNSNGVQVKNFDTILSNSCEQIIISFNKNKLINVLEDIKSLEGVNYNNICRHDDNYTIDVDSEGVSKGNSIVYLCKYLDVNLDDTIGFGDSDNDLSMFGVVGKSIAIGNANQKIKNMADDVVLSVSDNGFFKYIEDNILGSDNI